MNGAGLSAVIQDDIEAPVDRDEELLQCAVPVCAAVRAVRDVPDVVDPSDVERDVLVAFDEAQVSSGSENLGTSTTRQSATLTVSFRVSRLGAEVQDEPPRGGP